MCVVDLLLVGVMVSHRLEGDNRVRVGGGLWLHGSAETMNRCCGAHVGSLTKVGCGGACTSIYLRLEFLGKDEQGFLDFDKTKEKQKDVLSIPFLSKWREQG